MPFWCEQFGSLVGRRLRLILLKPRNCLSLVFIFLIIFIENVNTALKLEFFPYRVLICLVIFISEEAIQRRRGYKQLVYISGISITQYHLSNLLADTLVLSLFYLLSFTIFLFASIIDLHVDFYDEAILIIILGNLANLSFTYLVGLFSNQPLLL